MVVSGGIVKLQLPFGALLPLGLDVGLVDGLSLIKGGGLLLSLLLLMSESALGDPISISVTRKYHQVNTCKIRKIKN